MTDPADEQRVTAWLEVLDDATYYELLGVLEIADDREIKRAFHDFALAFHPDQHTSASELQRENVRAVFRRGAEAYRVLSDPGLRAKYDMALAKGHVRLEADEIPKGPAVAEGAKALEDLVRTPAAKRHAQRADDYISTGDLRAAMKELKLAQFEDGGENAELTERIDALDLALFAMGD